METQRTMRGGARCDPSGGGVFPAPCSAEALLVAFAAGVAGAEYIPWSAAAWAFVAAFACAVLARRAPGGLLLALFFCLGAWRGASLPLHPQRTAEPTYPACIRGTVIDPPSQREGTPLWQFSVWASGVRIEARASFPPQLSEGDTVILLGAFTPLWYGDNPGDDARFRLARTQWRCGTLTLETPEQVEVEEGSRRVPTRINAAARTSVRHVFPHSLQGLALGLFLGDRRDIPAAQAADFTRAGTAHLLAISGVNVAMIGAAIYGFLVRVIGPRMGRRRTGPQGSALALSALLAFFYAVLSGYSPSAARAAVGVLLATGVFLLRRRVRPMPLLCTVAGIILYLDPQLLWSISLQLSLAAVAGILRFGAPPPAPPLARRLARPSRAAATVALLLGVPARISAAAFLGSLLVSTYHFGVCHPWGILASMLTCPLLAVALTAGGAAVALGTVCVTLAKVVALPAVVSMHGILMCNALFASLPGDTLPLPPVRLAFVIIGGLCFLVTQRRTALLALLVAIAGALAFPAPCTLPAGATACNLPHGRAAFYRSSDTVIACLDRARRRDVGPVLRALGLCNVTVIVSADRPASLPLTADLIIAEPALIRLRGDLLLDVTRAPGGTLAATVVDRGNRIPLAGPSPPSSRSRPAELR